MTKTNMTTTMSENMMNIFVSWLHNNGYADNIDMDDQDSWNQLQADVYQALSEGIKHKESKPKKLKDPNKPKKNKSSYLFFCEDKRAAVKKDLGDDAKATEVTTELGVRWKSLKESTKVSDKKAMEKYTKQAAEDKERYDQEMTEYQPLTEEEVEELLASKKSAKKSSGGKKDPNKPKNPRSAYIFFCSEKREQVKNENPDLKATDVTSKLGELWRELKDDKDRSDELAKYNDMAEEDKIRYEREVSTYVPPASDEVVSKKPAPKKSKKPVPKPVTDDEETEIDTDNELVEEVKTKKPVVKKTTKKSNESKSSGKKMNGYTYFCSEKREQVKTENPEWKATAVTQELARMWKVLSKEEQKSWSEAAVEK
jgi:hypothetical protein